MSFLNEWKFRAIAIITILSLWLIIFGAPFKKGMDVAGGVELTYQIDFSKYRDAYASDADYTTAVQNAKNIIKNNITNRVNSMWVGDTEVRLLKVDTKDYIVVKVWGLNDIEAAKATIGKTVELEFKLPNEADATPEELAARKKIAEELLVNVTAQPATMKQLTDTRQSEDIYYEAITRSWDQLPQVYQDNAARLQNLSGLANQVFQGVYGQQEDLSGNVQTIEWFFIINIKGINTVPSSVITPEKLATVAKEFGLTTGESFVINNPVNGTVLATGVQLVWSDIVLSDAVYPGLVAYRATAYLVPLSWLAINSSLIANITGALAAGQTPGASSGYTQLIDDQWIDLGSLQSLQTGLTINADEKIKIVDSAQGTIVLSINETKSATDNVQLLRTIKGSTDANRNVVVARLTTDKVYSVEQIFVRDRASWVPAIEKKFNRVLNGAYFQSAATTQGQAWLPVVTINFNKEWSDIFCNLTAESVGKQMAIFVWGKLVTSPVIRDKICGGQASIDGQFTDQTCSDPKNPTQTHTATTTIEGASCLVANLNEGALPAPLILSHEATLDPTLGDNAWTKAWYATILWLVLVFGLLWYIYGFAKASIAIISLAIYLIVLLAFVKFTDYALSLSGIAAIILTIGMGVDSSILIFERLKEELAHGSALVPAILTAYERSWAPILDGNVSTGLIGFIMALVWSDVFQGFWFMMAINNVILLLFTVPLTKYLMLWWAEKQKNK